MHVTEFLMIASVGFAIVGSPSSSTRMSRGPYRTAPRMPYLLTRILPGNCRAARSSFLTPVRDRQIISSGIAMLRIHYSLLQGCSAEAAPISDRIRLSDKRWSGQQSAKLRRLMRASGVAELRAEALTQRARSQRGRLERQILQIDRWLIIGDRRREH